MRAVVLSNNQIIKYLNENFINTWVPNSELGRTPSLRDPIDKRRKREDTTFDTSHALAQAIITGWKDGSPVDCLVISPQFEVMGRQPVNDLLFAGGDTARHYLTFLQESLAGKLPGFGEDTSEPEPLNSDTVLSSLKVVLNDVRTSQEVLNIFRTPEPGYRDYTIVEIDTTAFKNGGMLTIDISVGHAEAAGSFDLFAGDSKLPTQGPLRMPLLQRGIFHLVEQRESHTSLIEVNPFGWELLGIGLAKREVPMLSSLQYPWSLRRKGRTKINADPIQFLFGFGL